MGRARKLVDCSKGLLGEDVDSWMAGVHSNVKGKQASIIARYMGQCCGAWSIGEDAQGAMQRKGKRMRHRSSIWFS